MARMNNVILEIYNPHTLCLLKDAAQEQHGSCAVLFAREGTIGSVIVIGTGAHQTCPSRILSPMDIIDPRVADGDVVSGTFHVEKTWKDDAEEGVVGHASGYFKPDVWI